MRFYVKNSCQKIRKTEPKISFFNKTTQKSAYTVKNKSPPPRARKKRAAPSARREKITDPSVLKSLLIRARKNKPRPARKEKRLLTQACKKLADPSAQKTSRAQREEKRCLTQVCKKLTDPSAQKGEELSSSPRIDIQKLNFENYLRSSRTAFAILSHLQFAKKYSWNLGPAIAPLTRSRSRFSRM